jgi:hypothetical protein
MVAGLGFLVAVEAHRRPGKSSGSAAGPSLHATGHQVPKARRDGDADAEQDGHHWVERYVPDPQAVDPRALRDIAIIRYDALQEMSGQTSFSVALLNSHGDGIVLSSINSRAETRMYAKTVVAGKSTQDLSPEEEDAIQVAQAAQGPATEPRVVPKPKITSQTGAPSAATIS